MTGMGEDGAAGLGQIKAAGGITIAQDEASCIVYGMPKAAVDRGYADRIVSLGRMSEAIIESASSLKNKLYAAEGN